MADFSERLKELRLEQGYTQQALADMIKVHGSEGMHGMSISGYERGIRKPSFEVLDALADIFNVSLDYLLGNTDVRAPYPRHISSLIEATAPKHALIRKAEQEQRVLAYYSRMQNSLLKAYTDADPKIRLAVNKLLDLPEDLAYGDR